MRDTVKKNDGYIINLKEGKKNVKGSVKKKTDVQRVMKEKLERIFL